MLCLRLAATRGARRGCRDRILHVAGVDDLEVALVEPVEVRVRQRGEARIAGRIDRGLDRQQMVDHGLGPRLMLFLPQEDEFALQVGVAERVGAVVLLVRPEEVMDGPALDVLNGRSRCE